MLSNYRPRAAAMNLAPPLIGRYSAAAMKRGEVVTCLYRDRDRTVTVMSGAPIPWPRCQPRGEQGGSGLWVNDELVKAIRTESAAALRYWFGVSAGVVWKWRKALGVGGRVKTTKGTNRAIRAAAKLGAAAQKARVWSDAERKAQSRRSKRLKLRPTGRWKGKGWTPGQLALLGTDHDEAVAKKLKRTVRSVASQRVMRKIPAYSGWPEADGLGVPKNWRRWARARTRRLPRGSGAPAAPSVRSGGRWAYRGDGGGRE